MTEFITRNYGNESFEVIIKTDSKEHYKATQDFARRLIDHAKPVTDIIVGCKWIPVAERLPEPFEIVLVYDNRDKYVSDAYMTRHKEWVGITAKSDVTHWMPLPDAPKGE